VNETAWHKEYEEESVLLMLGDLQNEHGEYHAKLSQSLLAGRMSIVKSKAPSSQAVTSTAALFTTQDLSHPMQPSCA